MSANGGGGDEFLATAVLEIADGIEALSSDPGNRTPEIQAEARTFEKHRRELREVIKNPLGDV